jgi:tetratricopeptide (TPR) repeat protein
MICRYTNVVATIGSLLILSACDPGALVKSKVPEPLQYLLTLDGAPGQGKQTQSSATLTITSPRQDAVFSAGEPVSFQAKLDTGEAKPAAPPAITWQLSSSGTPPAGIGNTAAVSKRLESGKYDAQVTATLDGQTLTKKVSFRVALRMPGTVTDSDGKPLAGTEIVVSELDNDTPFSKAQSDKSGAFSAEFPKDRYVTVTPSKQGYSFSPVHAIRKFTSPPTKTEFKAVQSEVSNVRLVDANDSSVSLENLCPNQTALLTFDLKASAKPTSYQAFLVQRENETEQLFPLDEISGPAGEEGGSQPSESGKLRLKLPATVNLDAPSFVCHIRLTVKDEKGNTYSVQAPQALRVDLLQCFDSGLTAAYRLLEAGKWEEAVELYDLVEKLGKNMEDVEKIARNLEKMRYNRGLAEVLWALAQSPGSAQSKALLRKAVVDFNAVLRRDARDRQALLLRALAHYLSEDYGPAIKDCNDLLTVAPGAVEPQTLRAFAYVKSGVVGNLSQAVDDLTDTISKDPTRSDLRKIRGQTLKLFAQYQDKKSGGRIDTGEIKLPSVTIGWDLKTYAEK